MGNGAMTRSKLWRRFGLASFLGFCLLAAFADDPEYKNAAANYNNGQTVEGEALFLCQETFKALAKYDAKIGMLDPYTVFKTEDGWILKIEGKMQNGFGAWLKVVAHCEVPFETEYGVFDMRSVSKFEYIQ